MAWINNCRCCGIRRVVNKRLNKSEGMWRVDKSSGPQNSSVFDNKVASLLHEVEGGKGGDQKCFWSIFQYLHFLTRSPCRSHQVSDYFKVVFLMRQWQISFDQTQPLSVLIFEVEHLHRTVHCNLLHCLTGKHFHCYCIVVSFWLFFVDVMMVWLHSLAVHSEVSATLHGLYIKWEYQKQ